MRWCSFTTTTGGPGRLGALAEPDGADEGDGPKVLDVGAWARSRDGETPADLVDLVGSSVATQERVTDLVRSATEGATGWVRADEVVYLAPLRTANSVRSLVAWGGPPLLAHANRTALLGPGEEVPWPSYAAELVATCEVAAVVGQPGRDVDADGALAHVFGFVLLNGWTVAGVEGAKARVATSLGPFVTTPDDLSVASVGTGATLAAEGGAELTGGPAPAWDFPGLLAAASAGEDLWPSDVLSSGPLTGELRVGRSAIVRAAVDGLGALTSRIG